MDIVTTFSFPGTIEYIDGKIFLRFHEFFFFNKNDNDRVTREQGFDEDKC